MASVGTQGEGVEFDPMDVGVGQAEAFLEFFRGKSVGFVDAGENFVLEEGGSEGEEVAFGAEIIPGEGLEACQKVSFGALEGRLPKGGGGAFDQGHEGGAVLDGNLEGLGFVQFGPCIRTRKEDVRFFREASRYLRAQGR